MAVRPCSPRAGSPALAEPAGRGRPFVGCTAMTCAFDPVRLGALTRFAQAPAVPSTLKLDRALGELADHLRQGIPQFVDRSLAVMHDETAEFFVRDDDPDFVEVYRRSYFQQLALIYDGLQNRWSVDGASVPALAIEEARMSASLGIPHGSLLQGYRTAHRLIFESVLETAHARIADEALRADVLRIASRWLFTYMDWVTDRVTEVYERERDLLVRDRDRRKRQLVRDLLEGQPVDPSPLNHPLDQEHLGLIAWGHEPERALIALREATGLPMLIVTGADPTAWGWLATGELTPALERVLRAFVPPSGVRLAIGERARDRDGFRLTYRQAWNTYRLARVGRDAVTWHADVALLALTLQDAAVAREFVVRELGSLAGDDERNELLRATLAAYFATGQNAAAAAAALGVHDRTVLYRLRSIEERLGHPILARREELGGALRLAPLVLAGAAAGPGAGDATTRPS